MTDTERDELYIKSARNGSARNGQPRPNHEQQLARARQFLRSEAGGYLWLNCQLILDELDAVTGELAAARETINKLLEARPSDVIGKLRSDLAILEDYLARTPILDQRPSEVFKAQEKAWHDRYGSRMPQPDDDES